MTTRDSDAEPQDESFEDPQVAATYIQAMRDEEPNAVSRIALAGVQDRLLHGRFAIRIYRDTQRPAPILMYFHGGGWVTGDLDTQDNICRRLARDGRCVVVSVEYRLAPEHPFPAALEDCYEATSWACAHATEIGGDPTRLGVMGASSGANLAAAVALRSKGDRKVPLMLQVLAYPPTDPTLTSKSAHENSRGYMLTTKAMRLFWHVYAGEVEIRQHPWVATCLADTQGLPPALVETAEFDILRDEGEAYAERMRSAGVDVEVTRHDGLIHGYFGLVDAVPAASAAVDQLIRRVRARLGVEG